jgi:phosphoesterase RecJ-like protein
MALDRATVEDDGRYCWTYVDEAMLRACNADGEDTEEIIQHLRQVENVEAAALFKDFDGAVRVSLRSSGRINVQLAAAALGGGGHFMAAGLTYDGDLAAAIPGVHAALKAQGL